MDIDFAVLLDGGDEVEFKAAKMQASNMAGFIDFVNGGNQIVFTALASKIFYIHRKY